MFKDHQTIWNQCLDIIKSQVNQQSFTTWFEPILSWHCQANTLTIQLPSKFFGEWLEGNYLSLLQNTIKQILGPEGKLKYIIKKEAESTLYNHPLQEPKPTDTHLETQHLKDSLNHTYTFYNFIEGDSNQLTKSAAESIAKNPGKTAFNPTIIYADVGLGKTHIAQAIVHKAQEHFSGQLSALYIPSEKFTSQFIEAVRNNSLQKFINYYTSLDLLVIDDIQFLAGKDKTQEIFFTIFNHLHQNDKQIVMTSDCRPAELEGLEKRLLSRFKWGLTTDLQMPKFETRLAIIQHKLAQNNLKVDQALVEYIATSVETNIRDVEGVVTSLVAHNSLTNKNVDYHLIKSTLESIICKVSPEITPHYLQELVADHYNVTLPQLKSKSRKREIVIARHVAMYLIKEHTNLSHKTVGQQFGGKDHTTVIYAQKAINSLLETDHYFKTQFESLQKIIKRKAPVS
ncbi:MAG: chromosomal replication initiator protein DnaA [Bacteroidota bacterium]